jgi:hypothetical protein
MRWNAFRIESSRSEQSSNGSVPEYELPLPAAAKAKLLGSALADIQGSVRANDSKANTALVVHGLLFAGTTTVITRLGPIYPQASDFERWLGRGLLAVAILSFLTSVSFLLRANSPRIEPALLEALKPRHQRVFFPDLAGRSKRNAVPAEQRFDELSARTRGLATSQDVFDEMVAEIVLLDAIHSYESRYTDRGYRLLMVELVAVFSFFVLVAVAAHSI